MLGVCAAYLSLPFMLGIAWLHCSSYNQVRGGRGGGGDRLDTARAKLILPRLLMIALLTLR